MQTHVAAAAELQPFTEYSCQVQAGNSAGKGDWSSATCVRTAPAATSAPVSLHASGAARLLYCVHSSCVAVVYALQSAAVSMHCSKILGELCHCTKCNTHVCVLCVQIALAAVSACNGKHLCEIMVVQSPAIT